MEFVSSERPSLRRVGEVLGALVLLAVVLLFVSTVVPQLALADHAYVVQSDSMSPAIGAGSVVYVSSVDPGRIGTGDVITFTKGSGDDSRVTHRVVDVQREGGEVRFRTKGDANEEVDPELVPASSLVGVVSLHVPLIGWVVSFAGTGLGMFLMVAVPAGVLLVLEIRDLLWPSGGSAADGAEPAATDPPTDSEVTGSDE